MKYPLTKEIYDLILAHKGDENLIVGNPNTKRQMKLGELNPTINTLKDMFKANDMPCELTFTVKIEGKKGKTKIKL